MHAKKLKQCGFIAITQLYPLIYSTNLTFHQNITIPDSYYYYSSRPYLCCPIVAAAYKIQVIQNKILREIVKAPWFVTNLQIHQDLKILKISKFSRQFSVRCSFFNMKIDIFVNFQVTTYNPQNCRSRSRRPRVRELLPFSIQTLTL